MKKAWRLGFFSGKPYICKANKKDSLILYHKIKNKTLQCKCLLLGNNRHFFMHIWLKM